MSLRQSKWLWLGAVLAAAALVLAACGGDGNEASEDEDGGSTTVELSAQDNSFEPSEISAPAGADVTVTFTNDGNNPHTFSSDEAGFDSGTVESGDSTEVSFTMPDEETQFICDIHGETMTGTLVPE